MELFLNVVAFSTILSLLVIWRAHWVRQPGRGNRNATQEFMAVCWLATIVFFAISVTDDLQGDLMVLEGSSISRSHSGVVSAVPSLEQQGLKIQAPSVAILAGGIALGLPCLTTATTPVVYSSTFFFSLDLLLARAPPVTAQPSGLREQTILIKGEKI